MMEPELRAEFTRLYLRIKELTKSLARLRGRVATLEGRAAPGAPDGEVGHAETLPDGAGK